jgi:2-aminoethylphosphonate-pyruvate transaminase
MTERASYLLTPGPLSTAPATRGAMGRDWGSRDDDFKALTARVRSRLVDIANGGDEFTCVPIQGSGTYAVEATLGTLVPRSGKALVLVNGSYGQRMARMCQVLGRSYAVYETDEDAPPVPARLDEILADEPSVTHVAVVHCETTSGILNPLEEIADVVARRGRRLVVDAMSSFGALPLDARALKCDAVVASANKCLEGVPGIGFAVLRKTALAHCKGNAHSLSLDLHDQWQGFERTGEWRYTPPTHVLAAFDAALAAHAAEGGVAGRGSRYARNCRVLVAGMRRLGFETFLPDALQAPIIVTFHVPADERFDFRAFYDALHARGYVIYPGKLTRMPSFRIGCIGQVDETVMAGAVAAVGEVAREMGLRTFGRARAEA